MSNTTTQKKSRGLNGAGMMLNTWNALESIEKGANKDIRPVALKVKLIDARFRGARVDTEVAKYESTPINKRYLS